MHVVFFNRSFYPETAATGQFLTELCECLVRDYACRISVVAGVPLASGEQGGGSREQRGKSKEPSANGKEQRAGSASSGSHAACSMLPAIVEREHYAGVEILRARGTQLSKARFIGRFINYGSYFLSACYAGLRLDRPDVVVALTDPPIIGLAGYLCARRFRAPLVMSFQDIFPEAGRVLEDFHSNFVDGALETVNRFLVRSAVRIIALGKTMRQRLIARKGADAAKTLIIPLWADCSEITPRPKLNEFSKSNRLDGKFVVMHSGNMGLSQGLDSLLGAAQRLRHYPDAEVVFVGDGVRRPVLERQARALRLDNVRFLPFQPKTDLKNSYAAADVFIVSLKRGLAGVVVPSKLYGILAAGRPYVAAVDEDCEVAGITREHECGLIAEPENPQDLAEKILLLYRNRELARCMGENARKAALQFDRTLGVKAYYDMLREVAEESREQGRSQRSEIRSRRSRSEVRDEPPKGELCD